MGIRAAVDVGAHRKHMYGSIPTFEEELWLRAFWCVNYAFFDSFVLLYDHLPIGFWWCQIGTHPLGPGDRHRFMTKST